MMFVVVGPVVVVAVSVHPQVVGAPGAVVRAREQGDQQVLRLAGGHWICLHQFPGRRLGDSAGAFSGEGWLGDSVKQAAEGDDQAHEAVHCCAASKERGRLGEVCQELWEGGEDSGVDLAENGVGDAGNVGGGPVATVLRQQLEGELWGGGAGLVVVVSAALHPV